MSYISKIPAIEQRIILMNRKHSTPVEKETEVFFDALPIMFGKFAKELVDTAPDTCDVGRVIAALDQLLVAQNIFSQAGNLGDISRKRRRSNEEDKTDEEEEEDDDDERTEEENADAEESTEIPPSQPMD